MNWETPTIIIVQILIFGLLYFLIKNLFPAYFSEKGKNLATKEDIEEITEKIKNVESKISIKTTGEIDYNSLKRKIVLDYFGAFNNWEKLVMNNSSYYGNDCELKNNNLIEKTNDAYFDYSLKEGEIDIFVRDIEFTKLRGELRSIIFALQHEFEVHCREVDFTIKTEMEMTKRTQKLKEHKNQLYLKRFDKLHDIVSRRNVLIEYLENVLRESFK
jgi:hypothetical protein